MGDMRREHPPGIEVLANESRRRIVALLAGHPRRPSTLARELSLSRSTIAYHLRVLEAAGVIRLLGVSVDDRARLYSLDPASTRRVVAWLAGTGLGLPVDPQEDPFREW